MNNNPTQKIEDQEIDFSTISKKISGFLDSFSGKVFKVILFIKKNIVKLSILFTLGLGLGYLVDSTQHSYTNHIIISPNFGSVDYVYNKIDFLQSKVREKDSLFLKKLGIAKPNDILSIKIQPILDIYSFVNNNTVVANNGQNTQNFELVRLLSEDGDINEVVENKLTSKNYPRHTIIIETNNKVTNEQLVNPIIEILNKNEYFEALRKIDEQNIRIKINENQKIIAQIDNVLNQFSSESSKQKNDKLVYYNENTQLNDVIQSKYKLITEIGGLKAELINISKFVKRTSSVINIKNTKGINGKVKLILPFLFIVLFIFYRLFMRFYNSQKMKTS